MSEQITKTDAITRLVGDLLPLMTAVVSAAYDAGYHAGVAAARSDTEARLRAVSAVMNEQQ